ncbi:pentatricopeptide repeat-containing protein, putative [Ectocarpus siliculosus]|uniref:Pentatricopeptide repeat-containing protein, putative n=1 Tax=Ectocarpus siliculosus TaxID=2880 RepID=D7FK79_ECTSI|nr:pentatricopeptide repeat-containing protein, putative [Ectocarpus siliculosus]|eukprot:CBJ29284.1 pentatricopeptide repeat-containing protein, putative [Ectocarpus siliculosus]
MVSKGLEPDVLTLSHLAMAQAWGSSNDMYRTLAEMDERGWTPTRAAHLSAIAFMWQRKDTEGVLQMIERMLEKSYQPTEAAFAMALMSAGRLGRADLAKVLFEWRSESGLEPKQEIYSSMMLAHSKADLHEESLAYWRQLVCLDGVGGVAIDLETCRSALRSAIVSDHWDEVDTIVGMLRGKREATPDHTYKLAIAACRSRSGIDRPDYWQRVERTVEALRKAGMAPSSEVVCRVAVVYAQGKQWKKAAAMFEQTLAQGVEMWAFRWECMMQSFFFLERYDDVRKTWRRSKTKDGGQHTVRANELAMTTAHRLLDAEWAKEIMAVPENRNPKKGLKPATLLTAVKILAETGRPREARQILQEWRPTKTTRINHKNFNELLLCCQQHGGTDVGLEFYRILRGHDALSRLQPATFAFVVGALCEHGRAGEAAGVLEEQIAVDYRPEKACYRAVASAASQSGDSEASAKFLEAAENEPPATMAVNTASDSGEEVAALAGREGGVLDGDFDGRDGGAGAGDASLRQQRTPPVIPGGNV